MRFALTLAVLLLQGCTMIIVPGVGTYIAVLQHKTLTVDLDPSGNIIAVHYNTQADTAVEALASIAKGGVVQ